MHFRVAHYIPIWLWKMREILHELAAIFSGHIQVEQYRELAAKP